MNRTFLVPLDIPDPSPSQLLLIASDIEDALTAHGLLLAGDVVSWSSPGAQPAVAPAFPIPPQ